MKVKTNEKIEGDCAYLFNDQLACPPCEYPATPSTIAPYPCPKEPEQKEVTLCHVEPVEDCPTCQASLITEQAGCKWYPEVCYPSTPPALPCAPVHVGFCQWDGGVPRWTQSCLDECQEQIARITGDIRYEQTNWSHVLDLSTHPDITTLLQVRTERLVQDITPQSFIALGVKLARAAHMVDAVPEAVSENNLGIGMVQLDDGSHALSVMHKGLAVGQPMPLVTTVDGTGAVTAVNLPIPA